MDDNEERRVRAKRSSEEEDRLSNLPDSLKFEVLLKLPTKDVVKTSLLSSKWRNLWKYVPGLYLKNLDFPDYDSFVGFVYRFLVSNRESRMQTLKLKLDWDDDDADPVLVHFVVWIATVVERKIQHIHLVNRYWGKEKFEIPPTVYTCESLVSLKLCDVDLPNPECVALTSLKVIKLNMVKFSNDLAFETLISACPVLESLFIERSCIDNVQVLRVCSQSLLSFTLLSDCDDGIEDNQVVVIDAPRLEYLNLGDYETTSFIINNAASLAKVEIDIMFNLSSKNNFDPNDLPKRSMIRKFLIGLSSVKVMNISSRTLEVIYNYTRYERIPLFRSLSSLHADFSDYRWEMLPIFLESCPNLKALSLGFSRSLGEQPISILPGSHSFLPTLESVEIVKPMIDDEAEMKLVSYFLENSSILKKLTLFVEPNRKKETSVILKKFLTIPRLSTSCDVVVSGPKGFW